MDVVGQVSTIVSSNTMGTPMFGIDVRNVGTIAVVVTSVGVVFRDGELGTLAGAKGLFGESVLPKRLDPGEAVSLANELQPVVDTYHEKGVTDVWARTAAGRTYRGRNLAKLARMKPSSRSAGG